jgi:AraC-like DNA-binding protein
MTMSNQTFIKADLDVEAGFRDWRTRVLTNWGMRCDVGSSSYARSSAFNWEIGRLKVATAEFAAQTWTPVGPGSAAAQWRNNAMTLKLVHSGSFELEHDGHCERFGPGSVVLVDCAASYRETFEHGARLSAVMLPKAALLERGFRYSAGGFFAADASTPDVGALRDFVLHVVRQGSAPSVRVRERLGEQLLDTMDIVTDKAAITTRTRSGHATLFRAKRFIEQHLGDPALDPQRVAEHAHASVDHLHRLFRAEGHTLMGYVWHARLAKAKRLLSQDAAANRMPIQEIAFQCGFSAAAHFSRMFRKQYGVAPREMAARVAAAG